MPRFESARGIASGFTLPSDMTAGSPRTARTVLWAVALAALVAVAACDSESPDAVALPLGSAMTYRSETVQSSTGDSVGFSYETVQRVVATDQTVQGERGLTAVEITSPQWPGQVDRIWYRVGSDRLDEVAYAVSGMFTPLRQPVSAGFDGSGLPRLVAAHVAARLAAGRSAGPAEVADDSVRVRTPPRLVFEYPLEEGRTWTHFDLNAEDMGFDFRSTRTVGAERTVATPEGDRTCRDVRTVLYFGGVEDETFDWLDCVDADGLVLRVVRGEQLAGPDGSETEVIVETTVRTSVTR